MKVLLLASKGRHVPSIIAAVFWTACASVPDPAPPATTSGSDSSFASLQERGRIAMGVDQYTSIHRFDDRHDGGRIELQRDPADSAGVATIRQHMREIATLFKSGDFRIPGLVHAVEVPGTKVMALKAAVIEYRYDDLPGGGTVVITTNDAEALRAIHEFLAFQRQDHRAGGHVHH